MTTFSPAPGGSFLPWEDYELAHSRVDTSVPETDLFAGLR